MCGPLLASDPGVCGLDSARMLLFRGRLEPACRKGDGAVAPACHDRVTASVWERSPRQHCGVESAIASGLERLANTYPVRFESRPV